ncbi:50S ribosomal protein L10 [Candidatus Pacearchaeota archaeon]|nr:50S ribosomal protein L10 [Candidatus Pacearchaeota archaeon]
MKSKKNSSEKKKISGGKIKAVKELSELMKNNRTVLIASVKNLPASQFQEISKKLRGKAEVRVLKKNIIIRAIDETKNEDLKKIKEFVLDSTAVLFSDLDGFELASELLDNKSPAKAKIGQEAPNDIEIEAGPTDLVPGPAISELGALGIQIQIDKGKIVIKAPKIIVKKGEKISEGAAGLMNKLDIKPFSVGFAPICAFDSKEGKLYREIKIEREGTLVELKKSFSKSLAVAVQIGYFTSETIRFIIGKARMHEMVLEKFAETSGPENKSGEIAE